MRFLKGEMDGGRKSGKVGNGRKGKRGKRGKMEVVKGWRREEDVGKMGR
jgi:hypothetical protein